MMSVAADQITRFGNFTSDVNLREYFAANVSVLLLLFKLYPYFQFRVYPCAIAIYRALRITCELCFSSRLPLQKWTGGSLLTIDEAERDHVGHPMSGPQPCSILSIRKGFPQQTRKKRTWPGPGCGVDVGQIITLDLGRRHQQGCYARTTDNYVGVSSWSIILLTRHDCIFSTWGMSCPARSRY
ncbi:hypothetical protein BJY00DRAFT_89917 [Aspergillus carlsbadensis]|nr:hypothetical protein BJY00DRAFT_89917 [Aspergillus carlsbadensis]